MVWWYTCRRHDLSISPWVRQWLRGNMLDRFFLLFMPAGLVIWVVAFLMLIGGAAGLGFWIGVIPFAFIVADRIVDGRMVNKDLKRFLAGDEVILATRCEYVGGHPDLPHGRFAYLLLEGTRENPSLTLGFPADEGQESDFFQMPVLDLDKMKPESGSDDSIAAAMLTSVDEKAGKFLSGERVTLKVDYKGIGRTHHVEITSFFHGNDEIRNWRNYLVCAQAEADTGKKPFGPWKSLKPGFPTVEAQEARDDAARNGHQGQQRRSAFARR